MGRVLQLVSSAQNEEATKSLQDLAATASAASEPVVEPIPTVGSANKELATTDPALEAPASEERGRVAAKGTVSSGER